MSWYEKDGFDELLERAIRKKRYDLIDEIMKAKDDAEREYYEALKCPKCGRMRKETPFGLFCPKCDYE